MKDRYFRVKDRIANNPEEIEEREEEHTEVLAACILEAADDIARDFNRAGQLKNFWFNYPPRQRGRAPTGDLIPWQEVGETSIAPNIIQYLSDNIAGIEYPGIPSGADVRFLFDNSLIHFDVKITGPRDRTDEVVASPNQISGAGPLWNQRGLQNHDYLVEGPRGGTTEFHPELPPFYFLDGGVVMCETVFLKGVYRLEEKGVQPLEYLELAHVPNGLLLFDTVNYAESYVGLMRPGKDGDIAKPRTRVKLNPLSKIAPWRTIQFVPTDTGWEIKSRYDGQQNLSFI